MTPPFCENLRLVLKMLSMSGAQLASDIEIDKSVVSRWLKGSVRPSAHNLSRLSALVATRVEGFRTLDWDRSPESLTEMFDAGARQAAPSPPSAPLAQGLPIPIWDQLIATSAIRARAYEGFFKSTRPNPTRPGQFVHEHGLIRRDDLGLLRLKMGSADNVVEGWMMPLHNMLYVFAADVISGTLLFGLFHGAPSARVDVFDGLTLTPASDGGRAPMAISTPMICERIADLSGDPLADDRRFAELAALNPVAVTESIPIAIRKHLLRDVGPEQFALGGDMLMSLSLARSFARGQDTNIAAG
jgi:transcriptional regulator with XRE-family HTH domain